MKSLRDEIAEALNSAYDDKWGEDWARHDHHRNGFYALCYVCKGDVDKLADRVRDRLMANHWMNMVIVAKLKEIADYYPEHIFTPEGKTPDGIAGTAIRERMLAEIRALRERAAELDAEQSLEESWPTGTTSTRTR